MMRGMTVLWTILALAVGVGLFLLKYEVQSLEDKLAGLNREIRHNQESIHILKAEWSYLNDPERLRELNERHMALKPFKPDQIIAVADLPLAPPRPDAQPDAAPPPASEVPNGRTMVDAPQPAKPAVQKPPVKAMEAKAPAPVAPVQTVKALEAPKTPAKPAELKPVVVATPKPVEPKPVAVAAPRPAVAPNPAHVLPAVPVSAQQQPNVLVIKSPALLEAERGRR